MALRSSSQLREYALKSVVAKGLVPWVERRFTDSCCYLSEIEVARGLSLLPEYKRGNLVKNGRIAETLNNEFHGGNPVRTNSAVQNKLFQC